MLSFDQLQQQVKAHFPDVQKIEDGVVRFIRKLNGRPFAVCYLALNPEIPSDEAELTRYQDRVVGSLYFEGAKSLQWSNYLYFITSAQRLGSQKVQRAKEIIESNRSYARKFVVGDREIDQILAPPVAVPEGNDARPNVISIWTQELVANGLGNAIFTDAGMPSRLAKIESTEPSTSVQNLPALPPRSSPPAFLRRLVLEKYRPFPLNKDFEFGTMNLVFGPNAAGKTSLLEAIELLYCGRNLRNEEKPSDYELFAKFDDGKTEKANPRRALQLFRDRNLSWYGQSEVLATNLYQSFSKFNFLDTDAAVRIAESAEDLDQDLSKLLIGPEASKLWDNISRVKEALESRLRDQGRLEKQLAGELAELVKRLKAIANLKRESDSIAAKLKEMIRRLRWLSAIDNYDAKSSGRIVSALAELIAVAKQAASLGWIESPITRSSLIKYASDSSNIAATAANSISELEAALKSQRELEENIKRQNEVVALLSQLRLLVDAQVHTRLSERIRCEKAVATSTSLLAGFEATTFNESRISAVGPKEILSEKYAEVAQSKTEAQAALQKTRNEYARFARLREESQSLAQQLREIAGRIIENSGDTDECPLCHTAFAKGTLSRHIHRGVDSSVEKTGQLLLTRQRNEENALKKIVAIELVYAWLVKFCERASLGRNVTVIKAASKVNEIRETLDVTAARLSLLRREAATLERRGLSEARLQDIQSQLAALKRSVTPLTIEAVDQAALKVGEDIKALTRSLQLAIKAFRDRGAQLQKVLSSDDQSLGALKRALSRLRERIATAESIEDKLDNLSEEFPWKNTSALADLVVSANAVSAVASSLQASLGQEREDRKVHADLEKRRKQLDSELKQLRARLKRLNNAFNTLSGLMKNHSLQDEMNSALLQNKKSIETIFSQIHAPIEFSGLSDDFPLLRRKDNGGDARLTAISTGQRAAYALSIFLAQNSQLTSAPPVMLIDDPIAHVDDLNALSFLDYLREVAIRGKRQIFFATANDKLATLIERKFDFLGNEFKRITLNRGA